MSTFDLCRHDCDSRQTYTRRQLLSLHVVAAPVSPSVAQRIQSLGLWTVCRLKHGCVYHYRGFRAGRPRRPLPRLRPVNNGAYLVSCNRQSPPAWFRRPTSVRQVRVERHSSSVGKKLVFSCHNIRSVANKLDDVLEVRRDLAIDAMFLVETWHDHDSVALRRLRVDGYNVVDLCAL